MRPSLPDARDPNFQFVGLVAFLLAYAALVFYAGMTNTPWAVLAADIAFAVILVGFGASVLSTERDDPLPAVAGAVLVLAGVVEVVGAAGISLPPVADLFLYVGVGLYFYHQFIR